MTAGSGWTLRSSNHGAAMAILVAAVVAVPLLVFAFLYNEFLGKFNALDLDEVTEDVNRAHFAFLDQLTVLQSKAGDWGAWDEAYRYVTEKDVQFEAANFTENVLASLRISAVAYFDRDLNFIGGRILRDQEFGRLESTDFSEFSKSDPLFSDHDGDAKTGLVMFKGKIALAASLPVTTGDGSAPRLGRCIFFRDLDENLLRGLSERTLVAVKYLPEGALDPKAGDEFWAEALPLSHATLVLAGDTAYARIPIVTMERRRVGALVLEIPRDVAIFGREATRNIVGLALMFTAAIVFLGGVLARYLGLRSTFEELRESKLLVEDREANLRTLIEAVPGVVLWISRDQSILGCSSSLASLAGKSQEDLVGSSMKVFDAESNQAISEKVSTLFGSTDGNSDQFLVFSRVRDERRRFFVSLARFGGEKVVIVLIDVTAEWLAEQKSLADRQIAVAASRLSALGQMAAGVAHEINNPLAIIQACNDRIAHLLENQRYAEVPGVLSKLEATTFRVAKVVRGMRLLARDGSKDDFALALASELVSDVDGLCGERIKSSGIVFRVGEVSTDMQVNCRSTQIGQVLTNLINNSVDAVRGLTEKWIALDVRMADGFCEFVVTDSGLGIPSEVVDRMMEPFFTTKGAGEGTGLGLSIALTIARDHGGTLTYDDESGHTRFTLRIPTSGEERGSLEDEPTAKGRLAV